jgi:hypothetical protein
VAINIASAGMWSFSQTYAIKLSDI